MLDLAGIWTLSDESGAYRLPCALPGDGISALQAAGLIPEPYRGRNEYGLRWIAARDWTAQRTFQHDGGDADLVVEGLDTVAEVRLNGALVLEAANAFRRWRVPVAGHVRAGRNEIEIAFRSSLREGAARQKAQPFFVPWHDGNSPLANGNMLRKPQCDFGWDWNIALAPFGVWGAIRLEPAGPRIDDVVVVQTHSEDRVEVTLTVHATGEEITANLCDVTAKARVENGVARLSLTIREPLLWWPAGLGPQVLHDLTLTSGAISKTLRIGLRALDLISEPDPAGRSFGFRVNGQMCFARGANWIPADALHGRITPEAVRDLLQSAVLANMNMIRVWGGGRYEPDWFYEICDELGLMVWQDFMFACNLYPSTPDFLAEVAAEVRDVVGRINHHACLALWCGDNELIGALTWFEASRKDRDRYLVSYDRLNRTVETALQAVLPGANWWPSSPSPGPLAFGDAWHDDSAGDMHFWSVWHEGRDFDHYRDVKPRFCSEFGFQSYPSMNVIRGFAEPEDLNIASPVMESHQKNAGGNARIAETMFRLFRFPVDFQSFVYLSQIQQGLAIKTAVTQWRSLKPHCMGTLFWQLNDTWPVCSWSSLDHGGGWKLLHHMAKAFFAPVVVTAIPRQGEIALLAVNDTGAQVALQIAATAVSMAGVMRPLGRWQSDVGNDRAVEIAVLAADALAADEVLAFTWQQPDAPPQGDVFAPRPWKTYDLPDPALSHRIDRTGSGWSITATTEAPAFFLAVEADQPGRFSRNAVALFPGYPARIDFTPAADGPAPGFALRHLHAATYGAF